jgi:outer membrane lipoprotein SlyB
MGRALVGVLSCAALSAWAQTCQVCGEIRTIREVSAAPSSRAPAQAPVGNPSGLDTGPVVGSVAQFQFGSGTEGRWSFGAAGTPEMQTRFGATYYELVVAMDSGEKRTVQRKDVSRFYVGQRVALRSGELEPMQP